MCVQHSYSQCWLTLINFAIFICTRGQYKYGREGEQRMQTQGGPSRPDDICASAQLSPTHTRDSCPDVSEPPCGMCAHCLAWFIRTVLQESKVDWFRNFHKNIEIKKIIGMRHPKKTTRCRQVNMQRWSQSPKGIHFFTCKKVGNLPLKPAA